MLSSLNKAFTREGFYTLTRTKFLIPIISALMAFNVAAEIYVSPTEGDLAELELRTSIGYGTDFVIYQLADTCKGRQFVQHPKDEVRSAKVRSGMVTSFAVGDPYTLACYVNFRFTPEANGRYILTYGKSVGSDAFYIRSKCSLSINKQLEDGTLVTVPNVEQLRSLQPWLESGSWCDKKE